MLPRISGWLRMTGSAHKSKMLLCMIQNLHNRNRMLISLYLNTQRAHQPPLLPATRYHQLPSIWLSSLTLAHPMSINRRLLCGPKQHIVPIHVHMHHAMRRETLDDTHIPISTLNPEHYTIVPTSIAPVATTASSEAPTTPN